ncbi:glycoside hydrolase family 23 protein [Amanita muscaria Koide BX008]|uniref:Glycoside hydrolase family 23 protein n=1 Tax=Amanita muscaria (strain Koide BX008) TaxID=946122 RepID=A0A0C2SRN3_AMAMK|nr:glycoside hydrolase family 23 protein [Amanita muscaria Koide BX008]
MRPYTLLFPVLAALTTISAAFPYDASHGAAARHSHIARRGQFNHTQDLTKRCKPGQGGPHNPTSSSSSSGNKAANTHSPAPPNASPAPTHNNNAQNTGGIIHVSSSSCGPTGATAKTSATTGPNGSIDWLNCGINGGGWSPPYVRATDVVAQDLNAALSSPNSAFKACAPYVYLFQKYGNMFNIPPIMLASFAMQESTCNPHAVGGAGEQGLMQISRDKCGGAPGGNCQDPDYNVHTGAQFFSQTLNDNGGNLLLAIGTYNGWYNGLTFGEATAAAKTNCCPCQNNLDYLHQFLNGWMQNIDARDTTPPLGKYFNLNVCF